ncbi:MAG: methionyl-tRNA formyltransferase [Pseudomonadota bacterium]
MRVVFMGTPDFAVPTLVEIIGHGHEVVACYTQPPRKAGRGMELKPSPVQKTAESFGVPVFTPANLKAEDDRTTFQEHDADVAVVVAYGLILPSAVLDAPRLGCLNLHASLLPRWRGAAPINRAIMAGDQETGVMVMRMEEGLDTGPVGLAECVAIDPSMTAGDLHDRLMTIGASLVVRALGGLERGALHFEEQSDDGATYAAKITKDETRIDWNRSASDIRNHVHGLSPFPGAWTEMPIDGTMHRVKVLRAEVVEGANGTPGQRIEGTDELVFACVNGALRLLSVQRSGKGVMNADEFLRGNQIAPDIVLT